MPEKFEKGGVFYVPVHALHTSGEYWGERGAEFTPSRFVENPDLMKEWFYLPFGGGPRNCIGMRLALMQGRACTGRVSLNQTMEMI